MKLDELVKLLLAKEAVVPEEIELSLEFQEALLKAFQTDNPQSFYGDSTFTVPGEVGGYVYFDNGKIVCGKFQMGKAGRMDDMVVDDTSKTVVGTFHTHPNPNEKISLAPSLEDVAIFLTDTKVLFVLVQARAERFLILRTQKTSGTEKECCKVQKQYEAINNNIGGKLAPIFSGNAATIMKKKLAFVEGQETQVNESSRKACIFLAEGFKFALYRGEHNKLTQIA
jgi:hypothetical protein